jgi:hypothetical protein
MQGRQLPRARLLDFWAVVDRETILIHQVHPVKLGFDIGASIVSNILLWQHRLIPALVARYLPPVVGSTLVIRFGDMDSLRRSRRARYVLEHMPPATTAIRLGGDVLMGAGSWRRKPGWIVFGALIVAAGWSHGLFFESTEPANRLNLGG